jgi:hypothetical protein
VGAVRGVVRLQLRHVLLTDIRTAVSARHVRKTKTQLVTAAK